MKSKKSQIHSELSLMNSLIRTIHLRVVGKRVETIRHYDIPLTGFDLYGFIMTLNVRLCVERNSQYNNSSKRNTFSTMTTRPMYIATMVARQKIYLAEEIIRLEN